MVLELTWHPPRELAARSNVMHHVLAKDEGRVTPETDSSPSTHRYLQHISLQSWIYSTKSLMMGKILEAPQYKVGILCTKRLRL